MMNRELPLFSDIYLGFINIFSIKSCNDKKHISLTEQTIEQIERKLLERQVEVKWDKKIDYLKSDVEANYAKSFDATEKFLFPHESNHFRRKLNSFYLIWDDSSLFSRSDKTMEIETFLTVYPKIETANLMFHMKLKQGNVDDIIFLKQLFSSPSKCAVSIETPTFFSQTDEKVQCVNEISLQYIKFVKDCICENENESIYSSNMIEIRGITFNDNHDIQNSYCSDYPQQIYGY
ncbi:hypothetical protein UF75_0584 [Desulfosporosinus sp. I2]|uniref:hypothetical protein n=1 Tax=Desulfosporosinus sp. I2 TaxID=1617025 RepID=UPI0005ED7B87|nr:hypothetical protein [Desulfosporosinus sp. I2]KJR49069.1 hypothetical protein UF75_0584 [Desulfosporosinus sp. I2]